MNHAQPNTIRPVLSIADWPSAGDAEFWMHFPGDFLKQKSPDARAGVDGGEDEQRLEHDREVIPVFPKSPERDFRARGDALGGAVEDVGHADGERDRAAGAAAEGFLREILVHADVFNPMRPGDCENLVVKLRHRRQLGVHRVIILHGQRSPRRSSRPRRRALR